MYETSEDDLEPSPRPGFERIEGELARLRKTLLRHGHAQEHFQRRIDERIEHLVAAVEPSTAALQKPALSAQQLRTIIELDQSVARLLELARDQRSASKDSPSGNAPASLREGLDFLQIRLRNLQRSFGLEPIPTRGRPFDDRLHRAESTCCRPDLGDGMIVEELLPGYLLGDEIVRPALVVVNRIPKTYPTDPGNHS